MSTVHTMPERRANNIEKILIVPITHETTRTDGSTVRKKMWLCYVYSNMFEAPIYTTKASFEPHVAAMRAESWMRTNGYSWADHAEKYPEVV